MRVPSKKWFVPLYLTGAVIASGSFAFAEENYPQLSEIPMNRPILEELPELDLGPMYYIRCFIDDMLRDLNRRFLRSLNTNEEPVALPDTAVYTQRSNSIDVTAHQKGYVIFASGGDDYVYHVLETKKGTRIGNPVRSKWGKPARLNLNLTKGAYYIVTYKEGENAPAPDINYDIFWTELAF